MTAVPTRGRADDAAWRVLVALLFIAWASAAVQGRLLPAGVSPTGLGGTALLAAGVLALAGGVPAGLGMAAVLAGAIWLSPTALPFVLPGVPVDPVRDGLLPLLPLLLLPSAWWLLGWRGSARARGSWVLLGAAGLVLLAATAATWDPFNSLHCPAPCHPVPPLVTVGPEARSTLSFLMALVMGAGGLWLAAVGVEGLTDRRVRDRAAIVAGAGATLTGVAAVLSATLALQRLLGLPTIPGLTRTTTDAVLNAAAAVGALLVAAAIGLRTAAVARARRRIRALTGALDAAPAPGTLASVLRQATGDPGLSIAYRLPDEDRDVDADGRPIAAPGRATATAVLPIGPAGAPIATVLHRPGVDPGVLRAAFTPSVLVALDNERLRAARLARVRELQASRARIVATADAERRRLERDLHDGAQQRLLGMAFDLRLRRAEATAAGRTWLADRLATAEAAALAGIEGVRRLARGVYPVVLAQAGLAEALRSLSEDAPIPMEVDVALPASLPAPVELAAYHVVVDALAGAVQAGAPALHVDARVTGERLVLRLLDAAPSEVGRFVRLMDRVGAAGGRTVVERGPSGGTLLEVELPCA